MPLQTGTSNATRSTNIREMLLAFKDSGRIGNTKPGSMKKAQAIAAAAAYRMQRKTIAGRASK